MKRPVTSLCRRPGKKTACGAACPRCGNNFRPQGRSVEGKRNCRAKAARTRAQKQSPAGAGDCAHGGTAGNGGVWCRESTALGARRGRGHARAQKQPPAGGRRLSGCGIWVLLAPGDPCDLDAQGGQHSQAEDHAQLSQGEICHQEQAMQSGDQQHSQEQQHAHAEGSQRSGVA